MELSVSESGTPTLRKINPHGLEILQDIVRHASSQHPLAEARFYPDPTTQDDVLNEDWKGLVQPELHTSFQAARDVVQADLRRLTKCGQLSAGEIPLNHINAWLNALNQARLALAEEYQITDVHFSAQLLINADAERRAAYLKMDCYALLQEWLIQQAV